LREEEGQPIIEFGEVEIGEKKEKTIWVRNPSANILSRIIEVEPPEGVEILSYPSVIEPKEVKEIKLSWSPNPQLKRKFTGTFSWKEKEVYL